MRINIGPGEVEAPGAPEERRRPEGGTHHLPTHEAGRGTDRKRARELSRVGIGRAPDRKSATNCGPPQPGIRPRGNAQSNETNNVPSDGRMNLLPGHCMSVALERLLVRVLSHTAAVLTNER